MKWYKFLKSYDTNAVGDCVQIDEAEAKFLLKAAMIEETTAPAEVAAGATELTGSLKTFVQEAAAAAVANVVKSLPRGGSNRPRTGGDIEVGNDNELDDPQLGYKHLGEQLQAVFRYVAHRQGSDDLMKREAAVRQQSAKALANSGSKEKAASTYAAEGVGADGGFSVAPDYNSNLLKYAYDDANLLARTNQMNTAGNTLTIPKDETVPWGTDGIQAYWTNEAGTLTQSKPKLGEINVTLQKLTVLVPVTNELLEDNAIGLGQYISNKAPQYIAQKINNAIVAGTGGGQPLGMMTSGAIITQAKDSGQAAATFTIGNATNMMAKMPSFYRAGAIWLHHSTVLPQILQLTIGNYPVFTAPGQAQNAPGGALWGKPLIESEQCQTLGTVGDIFLTNLNEYICVTKSNGIRSEVSMHIYFDQDITAFRFVFRIGGQPWMQAPIAQLNGGGYQSPFIDLATRA